MSSWNRQAALSQGDTRQILGVTRGQCVTSYRRKGGAGVPWVCHTVPSWRTAVPAAPAAFPGSPRPPGCLSRLRCPRRGKHALKRFFSRISDWRSGRAALCILMYSIDCRELSGAALYGRRLPARGPSRALTGGACQACCGAFTSGIWHW